jgi:aryl-alcohol dehydrogenase-like predicted oxidoreductase
VGQAIAGRRHSVLISTKATFRMGDGPNDLGSSRHHLIQACEASLRRLKTDYIDVYHLHGFDAITPVEETLQTLDALVETSSPACLSPNFDVAKNPNQSLVYCR